MRGKFTSLSDGLQKKYADIFKNPEEFVRLGNEIVAIPVKPSIKQQLNQAKKEQGERRQKTALAQAAGAMKDRIDLTPKQSRKVNALIKRLCCNYDNGNCIRLDDGDPCVCVQCITYSHIICKWFRIAVLPADNDLYIELAKPKNTRICQNCRKPYEAANNKFKYCPVCRKIVIRKQKANYIRKRRSGM